MKADSVRAVIDALHEAGARYLIVGGLAVVAHGYLRYTVDLDLVIALDADNVRRSTRALASLGYRPLMPVQIEDLEDARIREVWVREKGMVVFQLVSDRHPETPVDLFVAEPFDFEVQYAQAARLQLPGNLDAPVLALDQLLAMKARVDRPKDRVDVDHLRKLHEPPTHDSP